MADFFRQLLIVLAILMCMHQNTSSMVIDIKILEHNGVIPKALTITCTPEQTDNCASKVLALQLARNNRNLATLQHDSNILLDRVLHSNIKAEGHIDTNVAKSSLTVTFGNILMEDSGVYTCTMLYFDRRGHLHQDVASKNFTVESNNMYDVVRNLMEELSSTKKTLTEATTKLQKQHAEDISSINERTTTLQNQLNKTTTTLQKQLADQEMELKELRNRTDEYIAMDNVTSAFMAGYNYADTVIPKRVMKFREVKLNIGQNYDVRTSTYHAPVDGIYAFNFFVWATKPSQLTQVSIRVNNAEMASLMARTNGAYDQSSMSPVFQLKAGDIVNCFVAGQQGSDSVYIYPYTAFSGYLLKAI